MLLGIQERLLLPTLLPAKDSFEKLIIRKDVLAKIEFSQAEVRDFGMETVENQIKWKKSPLVDVTFTDAEKNYVRDGLKKASEAQSLTTQHIPLYEAFVNGVELSPPAKPVPEEAAESDEDNAPIVKHGKLSKEKLAELKSKQAKSE